RVAGYVKQAALNSFTGWHSNGSTSVCYNHSPYQAFSTVHGNTTNAVFTKVLLGFQHQCFTILTLQFQRIINFGEFSFKLHIYHSTDDLLDLTNIWHIIV